MTQPIHISYETAKANALQAYHDGRLGFQNPVRENLGCNYHYPDGGVCAIGASLPEDLFAGDNRCYLGVIVGHLLTKGLVSTDNARALEELQRLHDRLIAPNLGFNSRGTREEMIERFVDACQPAATEVVSS